jgi:hypothetical protein
LLFTYKYLLVRIKNISVLKAYQREFKAINTNASYSHPRENGSWRWSVKQSPDPPKKDDFHIRAMDKHIIQSRVLRFSRQI